MARGEDARTLRTAARKNGMRTLMEDAARKVIQGVIESRRSHESDQGYLEERCHFTLT